ncbi:hypothetical protein I302_104412 [Kwoniella bestiolae CBS 10118]|uniref:Uncharacterized protein n=1 Tax=Kwoniella bestiolae CBS 10118 TaxID=1296100 RepID=A0A1B9GB67_9TREE|nr:hypothetical protein I302_03116 [Kwoniella bestiolae CBS 10118]OCF28264.1 hypothetical protein I302_03116 [Kwoniella bestiolae CBS 10118]
MPIPLVPSKSLSKRSKPHNLIREPTFYQEAYLASSHYIQAIGNQLKRDWGFREIKQDDVARHQPFLQSNHGHDHHNLLLNLISPTTPHHIIQLPLSLLSITRAPKGHMRLSAFSTVLTPSYTHITESTYSIPPLRDLISFFQCLLPSSNALSLSLTPVSSSMGRCSGTSEDLSTRTDEEEETKERVSSIDNWRQDVGPEVLPPTRIATPSPKWLDRNEDMLRDTVGCGYYRRLREVAEDQKEGEVGLVQVKKVLTE